MPSTHPHPRPKVNRITHYGALALLVVMLAAAIGQVAVALRDPRAGLLGIAAVFTLLLTLPVIMLLTATPPVSADDGGLTLEPVVGRPIHVAWSQIAAVKDYPLLPPADSESGRRLVVGKRRYQPAEGMMLVIPGLPAWYRVTGVFCGEGLTAVVALTNRAHVDYPRLAKLVRQKATRS